MDYYDECPTCGDEGCPSLLDRDDGWEQCPFDLDPPESDCDTLSELLESGAPFDAEDVLNAWPHNDWPTSYGIDWVSVFRTLGFISDCEHEPPCALPAGTLRLYRGAIAQHVRHPSWSLSRAVAEEFAERLQYRRHADPEVWEAEIDHASVLAFLCSQDQEEVVVDPAGLRNLVKVGEDS